MKTKYLILFYLVGLSAFCYAQNNTAEEVPSTTFLLQLATKQLPTYLDLVRKDHISYYGFKSEDEFDNIKFGNPIQVCYLSSEFYTDSVLTDEEYLFYASEYRMPLLVNDTIRLFLIAGKLNNEWKIVGIGEATFDQNIDKSLDNYKLKKKSKVKLLLEPFSRTSYFVIPDDIKNTGGYYPVGTNNAMNLKGKEYQQQELFSKIHEHYKKKKNEENN